MHIWVWYWFLLLLFLLLLLLFVSVHSFMTNWLSFQIDELLFAVQWNWKKKKKKFLCLFMNETEKKHRSIDRRQQQPNQSNSIQSYKKRQNKIKCTQYAYDSVYFFCFCFFLHFYTICTINSSFVSYVNRKLRTNERTDWGPAWIVWVNVFKQISTIYLFIYLYYFLFFLFFSLLCHLRAFCSS